MQYLYPTVVCSILRIGMKKLFDWKNDGILVPDHPTKLFYSIESIRRFLTFTSRMEGMRVVEVDHRVLEGATLKELHSYKLNWEHYLPVLDGDETMLALWDTEKQDSVWGYAPVNEYEAVIIRDGYVEYEVYPTGPNRPDTEIRQRRRCYGNRYYPEGIQRETED